MLINNGLDSLVKLIKVGTGEDVQPFVLPTADYIGYVVVAGEIEVLSNYTNHYHVEGHVFKAIPLTAEADNSLFELLGKTLTNAELGSISFAKKGEFLIKDTQSTGLGYVLKVDFKAEIIVGEEPIPSLIKEVHVDVNNEGLIIEDSTNENIAVNNKGLKSEVKVKS